MSSTQTFEDRVEVFADADLLVVFGLSLKLIDNSPEYEILRPVAALWRESLRGYCPGVVELHLEKLDSDDARTTFLRLLKETEQVVAAFGQAIPASNLNEAVAVPGVEFYDYATSLVLTAIRKLAKLITG